MIILDTDILSLLDTGKGDAFEALAGRLSASENTHVCTTIISFEEQMRGWLAAIASAKTETQLIVAYARLHRMVRAFQTREMLEFDHDAAKEFARLRRNRVRIGSMDLRIAAIAITRDALLISRNLRDFRGVPGLKVADWTHPA